jgi:hypothetical protein
MAPKVDQVKSDPGLSQRYDELYSTDAFKSRLHNIVTTSRALLLLSAPGFGAAQYDPTNNSITVWQQSSVGVAKTNMELRDDIFFEMHNAKKSMAFNDLDGSKGYNRESLASGGIKKKAGYALATEWVEWANVAEFVILTALVNNQSTIGQLLPTPPVYQAAFAPGATCWLKFSNYLNAQLASGHTTTYDAAAAPPATGWLGKKILEALATKNKTDLEITSVEMAPPGSLNTRANPFTWGLLNTLQLT